MGGPEKLYQKTLAVALPREIALELYRLATLRKRSISYVLRQIIVDYLKKQKKED